MNASTSLEPNEMEPLFDLALEYRAGMAAVRQPGEQPGEYLGSGDGSAAGPGVNSAVRWDLNEHAGERACQMFFSGVIETDDGAVVAFDTLGFGRVPDPATDPRRWVVSASVELRTDDPRYAWLSERPATLVGEFDASTYRHRYRVARAHGSDPDIGHG
jgi:hypothetical protein